MRGRRHQQRRVFQRFPRKAMRGDRFIPASLVDRVMTVLLGYPRLLMVSVGVISLILMGVTLRTVLITAPPTDAQVLPPVITPDSEAVSRQQVVDVITNYNQASISAGTLLRPDLLAPYLAPDGSAWQAVQAEYQRRQATRETTDATLTRWGIVQIQLTDATAQVETQEQWDVVTRVAGQIVSSRRGILTRNTYQLRQIPPAGWQIVTIDTTTLIAADARASRV